MTATTKLAQSVLDLTGTAAANDAELRRLEQGV